MCGKLNLPAVFVCCAIGLAINPVMFGIAIPVLLIIHYAT